MRLALRETQTRAPSAHIETPFSPPLPVCVCADQLTSIRYVSAQPVVCNARILTFLLRCSACKRPATLMRSMREPPPGPTPSATVTTKRHVRSPRTATRRLQVPHVHECAASRSQQFSSPAHRTPTPAQQLTSRRLLSLSFFVILPSLRLSDYDFNCETLRSSKHRLQRL